VDQPTLLGDRYDLGSRIGAGGFGEVFDAIDRTTGERVAVKRLLRLDAMGLLLFKREFRLLADCIHANLVGYRELLSRGDDWWLVMDFVDGVDLRTWVRGRRQSPEPSTHTLQGAGFATERTRLMEPTSSPPTAAAAVAPASPIAAHQVERLRAALPQLEAALSYLHRRSLVHRDLKPANILVRPDGRLVVLDFGLALRHEDGVRPREIVGTARYMSPEQLAGEAVSPASDWYSVGVMIYALLTGLPPHEGDPSAALAAKRRGALDPRELAAEAPADLSELCVRLLDPDPARRPQGVAAAAPPPQAATALPFVGRGSELARLRTAADRVAASAQGMLLLLHGPSGMGKTALAQEFLAQFRTRPGALALQSRLYERESLPFKALDGAVDALVEHLAALPAGTATRLFPRYAPHLAHLFPALERVPGMGGARRRAAQPEPHEALRRGLLALRELLVRIGEARPLTLLIDDIQWSDDDSLAALGQVLSEPDPPPLLVIACCRSGERDDDERLAAIRATLARAGVPMQEMALGPLGAAEAEALASAALAERRAPEQPPAGTRTLVGLRAISAGHPLLLLELARAASGRDAAEPPSVAELLDARIAALAEPARALLAATAVAGRPRPLGLLARAAQVGPGAGEALAPLRAERLVRTRHGRDDDELAPFHDQVADAALRATPPEAQRELHRRFAETLAAAPDPTAEAESLYRHSLGAGETAAAKRWAEAAAERAAQGLAFERAAELYRAALDLRSGDDALARGSLRLRLADALANAGHGPAAARAYREASAELGGADARYALRRAAGQFLRSGHMDDGIEAARAALAAVGERWRETATGALIALQARTLWSWWRRELPRAATPAAIAPERLERMDSLWEIAHGLGGVDTIRAAELHARHLALALRAGDTERAAKGLAWEAILAFALGGPGQLARGWRLVERSAALALRCGEPHARAWSQAAAGYGHWCEGRLPQAIACSAEAEAGYRECHDVSWELGSVLAWCWTPALAAQGDLPALRRLCATTERECERTGDLYTLVTLRTNAKPLLHLADGDPALACAEAEAALSRWSRRAWHLQHLFAAFTRAKAALYRGAPREALTELDEARARMRETIQHRLQIKRIFERHLRALALIALGDPSSLVAAESETRALERERLSWSTAHAHAAAAALAATRRDLADSARRYRLAAAAYEALGMRLHAAGAHLRRAQVDRDAAALSAADADLRALGIADPIRFTATVVPGHAPAG
jgi:hypothetical protein